MRVSRRIAAIRLMERIERNPKYADKIGVKISLMKTANKNKVTN